MYSQLNLFEQIIFDILALGLVLFYGYSAVLTPASTLKDAVMGSTVQQVLRRAKVPVLVVRLPQK